MVSLPSFLRLTSSTHLSRNLLPSIAKLAVLTVFITGVKAWLARPMSSVPASAADSSALTDP